MNAQLPRLERTRISMKLTKLLRVPQKKFESCERPCCREQKVQSTKLRRVIRPVASVSWMFSTPKGASTKLELNMLELWQLTTRHRRR